MLTADDAFIHIMNDRAQRQHTWKLQSAQLNAKDPAAILQQDGPAALRAVLRTHREPLSALIIDAHIEQRKRHLGDTEGRYRTMRSAASLIAGLLPNPTATQISQLTQGRDLVLLDDMLQPVDNPQLPPIARALPADAAYQVARAAGMLGLNVSEVLAEVANSATRSTRSPKGQRRVLRDDPSAPCPDPKPTAPVLVGSSFPRPPLVPRTSTASAVSPPRVGSPVSRRRSARRPP